MCLSIVCMNIITVTCVPASSTPSIPAGLKCVLPVEAKLVADCVCDGLGVSSRSRAAAEYTIVDGCEFIGYSVSNVSAAGSIKKENYIKYPTGFSCTPEKILLFKRFSIAKG